MSEADRARERLDFEAAAEAIEKGKGKKVIDPSSVFSLPGMYEQRFVAATKSEVDVITLVLFHIILSLPNFDSWKIYKELCSDTR